MKARRTRQLAAVYNAVRAADHPTADQVYARVRRVLPRVSLGTVYRNLQKLSQQQCVRLVHVANRAVRYDAMLADHDHFVCDQCGVVVDLSRARTSRLRPPQRRLTGYTVRAHALMYYGRCPGCSGGSAG